jgi:transcriptional regulator EpsA
MVVANMQPKTKIRDKKNIMEGHITLTEREMEYLFRVIDSSTSIFLRHQFFLWAQGEVQSLLPHGLLICMFDEGSGQPISIEKFSRTNISEATFSELCRPDGGIVFRVISAWNVGRNRPVLLCPHYTNCVAYSQFSNDLKRNDLERMAAHGMFDANGRTRSLFTFTQIPVALTERHAYFLELLMPHMHMALVRMLFHERHHQHGTMPGKARKLITDRQTEILRHVQMGKSNDEIAHLLNISPLTVKNHVQKILHKLDVNNRAHAVAKAMALKITL